MGTVLNTFQYDPKSSMWRDRYQKQVVPVDGVYKQGNPAFTFKLAAGSYRRIIDSKQASYFYRSVRNWKRLGVNPNVFIDTGGGLWIEEYSISVPERVRLRTPRPQNTYESWEGPLVVNSTHWGTYQNLAKGVAPPTLMGLSGVSFSELCAYGAQGIARSIPTIPETSVFTILGELREGLASVPGRQIKKLFKERPSWANRVQVLAKGAGSEFLNWMFGIKPTLSDAEGLLLINSDQVQKVRDKLHRDNHAIYKRRRVLKNEVVQTITEGTAFPQYGPSIYLLQDGKQRTVTTTTTRIWFSGAFDHSAWKPTLDARINELLNAGEDLGLLPNAARIWQLVPYSWLVNWFLSTGEFLTNISYLGHSGLYMLYGYVMADTRRTITTTWTGKSNGTYVTFTTTSSERIRQRVKASPYGFGLKVGDLSATQMAILASLGITRTKLLRSGTIRR